MIPSWWKAHLRENLFKNHSGFFELPYLSNTPLHMLDSIAAFPHATHNKDQKLIHSDTEFLKGGLHYCELQEGLWLIGYDLEVNKNLVSIANFVKESYEDYYFLSYCVFKYNFPTNKKQTEFVTLDSTTCIFYKPQTRVASFFYEKTKGKLFNIVFTKDWAKKHVHLPSIEKKRELLDCLDGKTGLMNWINIVPHAEILTIQTWKLLTDILNTGCKPAKLVKLIKSIVGTFFNNALEEQRLQKAVPLYTEDYYKIALAEQMILCNLTFPFMGVEQIAKAVHLSPTKLKQKFKIVFGFSMLQYHKEKNMILARQLLQNSSVYVGDIALLTGYTSVSKFTATFRKRFELTPSEVKKSRSKTG